MYFMYISPIFSDIMVEREKITEYEKVLSGTKELKVKRDNLTSSYNEITAENLALLNKLIPNKFDSAIFANDINGLVSRNALTLLDLKVDVARTRERNSSSDSESNNVYRVVTSTVKVTGSYDRFVRFLKDLESSLQLVDVTSLNIVTSSIVKSTDVKLEYTLEINTYSLQ